ncbi:asparagine synthase (glutamine-hydrolyzing) [Flavisolibacter nicotianae]|uniref:asparagine synthase (glutamine-hydrolyzing) n=1 Tax=Flavisolibacter nicotianae TaxID=2364882 RepID=UPI000EB2A9A7|nr:asparagine synthase (glutamine-hydrolyzing) [Flavisolibacter nicotianae]
MCGIIGSISHRFQFAPEDLRVLQHRGPDDEGYYCNDGVMLGQTRLSIVDVSANGHQPMLSADGDYVLVFNGEIYNHLDIRSRLKAKGYSFKSGSDTETLLYGFMEYGKDILPQLNGIFAFCVLDKRKQEVVIARDHYGIKPLYYYYEHDGVFAFASEIKALLKIPGFDKTINPSALFSYLQLLYSVGGQTPFQNVLKLLPGHCITYSLEKSVFTVEAYDEIRFEERSEPLGEEEWKQEFRQALQKAVARQLMSDVPLGYFLSGGLDSSLIVAMAKEIMPGQRLTCFTIDSGKTLKEEGFADDLFYAKKVARHLSVDLNIIPSEINILDNFDKMIWHLDEPQADAAPLNVYDICLNARQQGIKVLLGGTAGDDLLSGYRRHQAIALERFFRILPVAGGRLLQTALEPVKSFSPTMRRIKKVIAESGKTKSQRFAGYFMWLERTKTMALFEPDVQEMLVGNLLPEVYLEHLIQTLPPGVSDLNKMLYLELKTYLPDHNLNYTDKMSMAVGVETRVPYLDIELVKLSSQLPSSLKMKGTTTKYILRKVAEDYLPHDVIYRPKTGFGAPLRGWVKNEMREMVNDQLSETNLKSRGLFNAGAVREMIDKNQKGKLDASYTIWSLLAIESWLRQFVDGS